MSDYNKTGPFTNGGAPGISSAFLNNVENVFVQPSGGTETGRYHFISSAYANNASIGAYVESLSRGATPVSVTVDTSGGLTNMGGVGTSDVTSNGFLVSGTGAGPNLTVAAAGAWTIQY